MTEKFSRWSEEENRKLLRLRDVDGLGWREIARRMPGRTASSCENRYYNKLLGAKGRAPRRSGPKSILPAVSWRKRGAAVAGVVPPAPAPSLPPPAAPLPVAGNRQPCLDALRERAELRLRIAERGLTGGVFGDPPPGRSALDERLQGRQAPLQPSLSGGGSDAG